MTWLAALNLAIGRWMFRYRNAVFPAIFTLVAVFLRPRVLFGHPRLDHGLIVAGALIALLGEAVRLLTIGFDYIERGGKDGKVWASKLVQGGIYAHTRNPMYLGNLLIAIGMCMVTGAPAAYLIIIPLFMYFYQTIMVAEEIFLRQTFDADYAAYCSRVPRILPSLRGIRQTFAQATYDWRRAIRKDLSTITGLLLGLACLPLWRTYFLEGFAAAKAKAPVVLALVGAVLISYFLLHRLKKRRLFFYLPGYIPTDLPRGLR